MKIETLKELEQLIALCRKRGVDNISVDGITVELGHLEPTKRSRKPKLASNFASFPEPDPVIQESMTEEELLFYSAPGNNSNESI